MADGGDGGMTPLRWVALGIALVLLAAMLVLVFWPPALETAQTQASVRFLAATAAGLAAFLWGWDITAKGMIWKLGISGSGAGGAFAVVLVLFYWGIPQKGSADGDPPEEPQYTRFRVAIEGAHDPGNGERALDVSLELPAGLSDPPCFTLFSRGGACLFDGRTQVADGLDCARVTAVPMGQPGGGTSGRALEVRLRPLGGSCAWTQRFAVECADGMDPGDFGIARRCSGMPR